MPTIYWTSHRGCARSLLRWSPNACIRTRRSFFRKNELELLGSKRRAGTTLAIWHSETVNKEDRQQAVEACMAAIQRAEIDTEVALFASDAAAAIAHGLRAITDRDPREAAWAAQRAYDTVFRLAKSQSTATDSVANIDAHPVVQQELERQVNDIVTLKNLQMMTGTIRICVWSDAEAARSAESNRALPGTAC